MKNVGKYLVGNCKIRLFIFRSIASVLNLISIIIIIWGYFRWHHDIVPKPLASQWVGGGSVNA